MTPAAGEFVSALTLSTLSKNPVLSDLAENNSWSNHVMLGRWADVMMIAPLSCNTLAKMAHGMCDNLFMAVYLSATCPVIVAPAMDEDMWHHTTTKNNLQIIQQAGNEVIPVENGELASGLTGDGRMAAPEDIVKRLEDFFSTNQQLQEKNILVTAGPTYEALDPVRFIGNHSSGKMGIAIAGEFKRRGANVTLVLGPSNEPVPEGLHIVRVKTAEEMFNACAAVFDTTDIAVMSAAVADYTPVNVAAAKIKKAENLFSVELKKTKDILKHLGTIKKKGQLLAGFALETNDERKNALKKLEEKNADLIILNSMNDSGAGFGGDTNKIAIFDKNGGEQYFETKPKKEVAVDIVNAIIHLYYA
jgi:phosphopantothenoylcysteine decarboxylase/phosphopantothenate--cysteine ligase